MNRKADSYHVSAVEFMKATLMRLCGVIFYPLALRIWQPVTWKTIRIVDPSDRTKAEFVGAVRQALELVELVAPSRFARVKREIRVVINAPAAGGLSYLRGRKICKIDFAFFHKMPDGRSGILLLACMLVNAATQGYLYSKRMAPNRRTRDRLIDYCYLQEGYFARKLGLDLKDWAELVRRSDWSDCVERSGD